MAAPKALIDAARAAHRPLPAVSTQDLTDGPRVQLSVRLPDGLRAAITETADAHGRTVTDYVVDALTRAVRRDNDSTAALRDALFEHMRPQLELTKADLSEATDAIDRDEASWQSRP